MKKIHRWVRVIIGLLLSLKPMPVLSQPESACFNISLPLKHLRTTSGFGWRVHPITGKFRFHRGIDLAARSDTVYSILDGIVSRVGNDPVTGNYVLIVHEGGIKSLYGHLSTIAVLPGEQVAAGQPVARTGSTGIVTGEHLHFAIRINGHDLSPLAFLNGLANRPP